MNAVLARLRRRLSFANVTSGLALFVALGGTSYAAISLPSNSVGAEQIRSGAVGKREIRTGGVGKGEVKTGGIGSAEIRTGAVRKSEIKTGGIGAAELRTNSVRSKEIKDGRVKEPDIAKDAVTADQIAKDAVTGEEVKDASVGMADLDAATQGAIAAAPFRAAVNSNGAVAGGNAKTVGKTGTGAYNVDFGTDISKCTAVATLAQIAGGTAPDAGAITVAPGASNNEIVVKTFDAAGTAKDEAFNLVVAC